MFRRFVLPLLAVAFIGASAQSASAQIIYRMNYAASAYPNAGWSWGAVGNNGHFTMAHLPGGGPQGQDAIELRHIPNDPFGQFYWGWGGYVEGAVPQGAVRYYRWRMYFPSNTNFSGRELGMIVDKLLIVGDGCGENCRIIVTYKPTLGVSDINFDVQLDGGVQPISSGRFNPGQWLNVQVEARSSSSTSSSDGGYKIWVNNNNYGSPNGTRTGMLLRTAEWGLVKFGAYCNANLAGNGVNTWRSADFQVASTFDASWNVGGSTPPPSSAPSIPQNVRVMP